MKRWMVACRPVSSEGRWHLVFSNHIYLTEEEALRRATELNYVPSGQQVGYIHVPVEVCLSVEGDIRDA